MSITVPQIKMLRDALSGIRAARATFVRESLRRHRWSVRAAALAIGTNHTTLGSRLKGETGFQAEEIEALAHLIDRDPVDFYKEYISVGPAGLEPTTSTV